LSSGMTEAAVGEPETPGCGCLRSPGFGDRDKCAPAKPAPCLKERPDIGGVFLPPFYENPERFTDEPWVFLRSKRFGGNPRNLAGAMAGLPELSWKRFKELQRATSPQEAKAILAKTSTDDLTYCHMKEHPDELLRSVFGHSRKERLHFAVVGSDAVAAKYSTISCRFVRLANHPARRHRTDRPNVG
jgi:hypothetical protein